MPSTAITAQGITIARFGTTTFETIPNVVSFQGPGGQASVIDVTNLASTSKEKRVGLRDEGQLSLTSIQDHVHRHDAGCNLDLLWLCDAVQRAGRRGRRGRGKRNH